MRSIKSFHLQKGYFLFLAVIFIVVMGVMGVLISYMLANRAQLSVANLNGLRAFYIAESGLEIGGRLLSMPTISGTPTRLSCAALTGTAAVTNAAIATGTFTLTTLSSPVFAFSTLNGAINSSASSLTLTNAASFATSGRIVVDKELINYASKSSNTLLGLTRGAAGSSASSHANSATVAQYQCSINADSGIPSVSSATYKRQLQSNVQLQDGWAVGNRSGNDLVHTNWNQETELTWTASPTTGTSSTRVHLTSVSMLSNADGWAVGQVNSNNFILSRWNGSAWSIVPVATPCTGSPSANQDLTGVSLVSSQEGWAVGARYRPSCTGSGVYRYTILKWNGSTWTILNTNTSPTVPTDVTTNQNLNAVHVIDTDGDGIGNIGFAVGNNGTILQYNGTNWVSDTSPVTTDLNGVFVVSASEAWAVGASGTILRWNGSAWGSFSSPVNTAFNAIAMIDTNGDGLADAGWIAANSGRMIYFNGSSWALQGDVGNNNLFGVGIFNTKDVWSVGAGGTALHYDGSSWASVSSSVGTNLNAISLIPQGNRSASTWEQVFR